MTEKEIEFKFPKTRKTLQKLQIIYTNELLSEINLKNCFKLPPSPVKMGMDKIHPRSFLGKYIIDFVSSSTIHGLNHLAAPRRHIIEKFLAGLIIISALTGLILLSINFWDRYQTRATATIIDHDYRDFSIKAPAILVCPDKRVNSTSFPAVFEKYGVEDTLESRNFFTHLANSTYLTFDKLPDYNVTPSDKWLDILYDLKPEVEDDTKFKRMWVVTEWGHCLAYNNYISVYNSFEYWKNNNWTTVSIPHDFPFYNFLNREVNSLITIRSHEVMFGIFYSGDTIDFQNILQKGQNTSLINIGTLAIEVISSSQIEMLSIKQRGCKFSVEGGLKLWPVYERNMCRIECRYNQILKVCHCYPHFARPTFDIPICNISQLKCITNKWSEINLTNNKLKKQCGCVENCNSTYYTEVSSQKTNLGKGAPRGQVISPRVIFPTNKYLRVQIYGFNDFLISVGGAAGLLLGASVISLVEIFYFFTLRLFFYRHEIRKTLVRKRNIAHANDNGFHSIKKM